MPDLEPSSEDPGEYLGSLSVGSEKVRVLKHRKAIPHEDGELWGYYHHTASGPEIRVHQTGTLWGQTEAQTTLHELIHAISETFGLELSEQTTRTLEQCLLQALASDTQGLLGLKRTQ